MFLEKQFTRLFHQFKLTISLKMSSGILYWNVVRSGSSDEDLGLVHGEQGRKLMAIWMP